MQQVKVRPRRDLPEAGKIGVSRRGTMDRAVFIPPFTVTPQSEFGDDSRWAQTFGEPIQVRLGFGPDCATKRYGKAPGWVMIAFPVVSSAAFWLTVVLASRVFG